MHPTGRITCEINCSAWVSVLLLSSDMLLWIIMVNSDIYSELANGSNDEPKCFTIDQSWQSMQVFKKTCQAEDVCLSQKTSHSFTPCMSRFVSSEEKCLFLRLGKCGIIQSVRQGATASFVWPSHSNNGCLNWRRAPWIFFQLVLWYIWVAVALKPRWCAPVLQKTPV